MYLDSHNVVFTTLALGDVYRDKVATQIQSVLKFSRHDMYVITDKPEFFGNYYGDRVKYINFEGLTDLPLIDKHELFNYNMKMIPIKWVIENIRPQITVYMDADSFLFGNFPDWFHRFFPDNEYGIYGRFRQYLNDNTDNMMIKKVANLGIDVSEMSVKLPIENIMIFKNGPLIRNFFEEWLIMAKLSYETGSRSDFECIEMAIAIWKSGIPYHHLDNACPYVDCFRTVHHNKIHIPFVI